MERIELEDGRVVAYETYGDPAGKPVLLLHGFSDSRLTGAVLADAAERQHVRLLVPDRPGTGLSTGRLHALSACGPWLAALLDRLGLERVPLAAVSGGGPFALACAHAIPQRLERVLVISGLGPPELGTSGMPLGQRFGIAFARRAPRTGAAVMAAVARLGRASPRLFLALVGSNTCSIDAAAVRNPEAERTVVAPFLEAYRCGSSGVESELRLLLHPWDFRPEEIDAEVRFEHGAEDATVPPAAARELARRVPGAELRLREGVGHFTLAPRHGDELLAFARG